MDEETRFRRMFQETYSSVRRYARHRGLAPADADDLVAEVFTVAWRKLDRVPRDNPLPWLLAVARNHWRNSLRRSQREKSAHLRLTAEPVSEPAGQTGDRIREALDSLPAADREILQLVAWDELTPREAAVVLGCTPAAARVRLHRARSRLAKALPTPVRHEGRQRERQI
ncbi:MAG TPA: sigma-70 family RNA polymerase sigma factor [Actinomycetota bacterium]|nr:sigma-70 family RNA polymerase sigma factor [Actinomycetota bacterium]